MKRYSALFYLMISSFLLVFFQNCGPSIPSSNCASDSGDSSGSSPLHSCDQTTSEDSASTSPSSPFLGGSSSAGTGGSSNPGLSRSGVTSRGGESTLPTGPNGEVEGGRVTRNCTSTSCTSTKFMFSVNPISITLEEGTPAYLIGAAVNAKGDLTYQWYKDGTALAGKTSKQLNFFPIALSDQGSYFLEAKDDQGAGNVVIIKTNTVSVSVKEIHIQCPKTTYGYWADSYKDLVYGDTSSFDLWNPPGHKFFLPISDQYRWGVGTMPKADSILFDPPGVSEDESDVLVSCAQVAGHSGKVKTALGVPTCGTGVFDKTTLVGNITLTCLDGRFEYTASQCTCGCPSSKPIEISGSCYEGCTGTDPDSGSTYSGYMNSEMVCVPRP